MARLGLATLISAVRAMTNATTADATIGTETYFTDDHLQLVLDSTQMTWDDIPLEPMPTAQDSTLIYLNYRIPDYVSRNFEENAASSGWALRDATGSLIEASAYSVNYQSGIITFNEDTGGLSYNLSCRTYNLNRTASSVWLQKASFAYQHVDWGSDNHRLQASQQFAHALHMAEFYASKAGPTVGKLLRTDEVG